MMRQKTTFWQFSICLFVLLLLVGCEPPGVPPELPDFDKSQTALGELSETLIAHIYFDATLSMQGFVNPGPTHYTAIHRHLEGSITTGRWRNAKVKFFRFGEQVEKIDRNTYLKVESPEFYENKDINRETFIQKVIDSEIPLVNDTEKAHNSVKESTEAFESEEEISASKEENRLVIIVTDLFQDRNDINLLVSQLKEGYLKRGVAVGLLGVRSEFDGKVYDTRSEPIPYKSEENPETFRPFYLLVLGRHADIAHYFDRLTVKVSSEVKTVIFSNHLVNPLGSFEGASVDRDNLNSDIFDHNQDDRLQQFSIVKATEPAKISATLAYVPLPYAMSFESKALEILVIAKHAPRGKTEESPDARKCLDVTPTFLENELTVDFSLTPQSLPKENTIYLYEVTLVPKIDRYGVPEWCSAWDMGMGRDGSKTLNLVNFVQDLSQIAAQIHRPKIAKFYFYIKN